MQLTAKHSYTANTSVRLLQQLSFYKAKTTEFLYTCKATSYRGTQISEQTASQRLIHNLIINLQKLTLINTANSALCVVAI